jgi:hypothetical protein
MLTRRKGLITSVDANEGWFTLASEAPLVSIL